MQRKKQNFIQGAFILMLASLLVKVIGAFFQIPLLNMIGGKDSPALLCALEQLSHYYPEEFTLVGIAIDLGSGMDYSPVEEFCNRLGIEFCLVRTEIQKIVFNGRRESNPCSLCAKMRKGALVGAALERVAAWWREGGPLLAAGYRVTGRTPRHGRRIRRPGGARPRSGPGRRWCARQGPRPAARPGRGPSGGSPAPGRGPRRRACPAASRSPG